MSKIPTGTVSTMPLKNVYKQKLAIVAAVAYTTAHHSPSLHHLHSSTLVASFIDGQQNFSTLQNKFKRIRNYSTSLPEYRKIMLPALSPTMEKGNILTWNKKEGDKLLEGDVICEIETDKAAMGVETSEEGYLAKILISEGTKDVPVGKLLCIIVENENDIKSFSNYTIDSDMHKLSTEAPQPSEPITDTVKATPFAKQLADEKGMDLSGVKGSGPAGRVLASDLITGGPQIKPPNSSFVGGYFDLPLNSLKQALNNQISYAKSNIPHYYLTSEIILDELERIKQKFNSILSSKTESTSLTILDFIIKAVGLTCLRVPESNSFFLGDCIRENKSVNVSITIPTENGFVLPVIHNVTDKGIASIHDEITSFKTRANAGQLEPHEFKDATFSVSMTDASNNNNQDFTSILNPPQSCNLTVGNTKKKLLPTNDDGYTSNTYLNVTLSCDHRVIDGALGATWLRIFKNLLENPITMLK